MSLGPRSRFYMFFGNESRITFERERERGKCFHSPPPLFCSPILSVKKKKQIHLPAVPQRFVKSTIDTKSHKWKQSHILIDLADSLLLFEIRVLHRHAKKITRKNINRSKLYITLIRFYLVFQRLKDASKNLRSKRLKLGFVLFSSVPTFILAS
ncbi:hypothetical protein L1887_28778 [Cichorium endivia]|nr:hypothetical protein L1887_28778 [Cichorium endivia]